MLSPKARRILGIVNLLVSLVFLLWGYWPLKPAERTLLLSPQDMQLPAQSSGSTAHEAVPEFRRLILTWPSLIRSGETGVIRLRLNIDQGTPAEVVSNVYDSYNVLVEARLDLPGVDYSPQGEISQGLLQGRQVNFLWDILPRRPQPIRGALWLHLRFVPLQGGPEQRIAISAQVLELRTITLFGFGSTPARVIGIVGSVVGLVFLLSLALTRPGPSLSLSEK